MTITRRKFLASVGMLAASTAVPINAFNFGKNEKLKIVLVGTGIRGISFWGKRLVENYSDILEYVGLRDINPGRLEYAKKYIGVSCPVFTDFEKMIKDTTPDLVIIATVDSYHHEYAVKGLDMGCDVLTEKPITTDEKKAQEIIDAEKRNKNKLIVGFNYRWTPYVTKVKELLMNKEIGDLVSVDFNWMLNTYHGASYFRRWHGIKEKSGTLLVHKASHHFDLLNWWIDSDPEEVFAYGDLEFYGDNSSIKGDKCRTCNYKKECKFYWDITKDKLSTDLYVKNEKYDGYIRDNCLFRKEINIYDKMSVQTKYKNNVVLNYSLTTYSPFEGWRVSLNGTKGRIDAWLHIPFIDNVTVNQAEAHVNEMDQKGNEDVEVLPIVVHKLWQEKAETINVISEKRGHGGGDKRLQDKLFRTPEKDDPFKRAAGLRDGIMAALIGISSYKSIESGDPIKIADLTTLKPRKVKL